MKSGVYVITAPSGKRYIGSATSLKTRKAVHWHQLQRGVHHNAHLQRSWRRYGGVGFDFRVLLVCEKEHLLMYEQRLIDGLHPEFNICRTAGSCLGVRHTPETKAKYRDAMKRRIQQNPRAHGAVTAKANERMRVLHADLEWRGSWLESVRAHGETMAKLITWAGRTQSVTAWARELGVPRSTLKHRIATHGVDVAFSEPVVQKGSPEAWVLRNKNRGVVNYAVDGSVLTKTAFAAYLGVSRVTLRQWELGGLTQVQMVEKAKALR